MNCAWEQIVSVTISNSTPITTLIKQHAHRLGFDHCRITPIAPAPHADFFDAWLDLGRAGEMTYLERNREKRRHPHLLADADAAAFQSIIVLAVNHYQFDLPPDLRDDPSRGIIASYAWGEDYHEIIRPLLYELDEFIRHHTGRTTRGKCLVDTGPVLERDWAMHAGIGFTGKNCCTIHPTDGSWLLLSTIMVPEALDYDPPPQASSTITVLPSEVASGLPPTTNYGTWHISSASLNEDSPISNLQSPIGTCGQCTRCLDACPTNAFIGPYHLDPQRCISYWTIESKQTIPRELRPRFANRIFGCDICQEVCPWNKRLSARTPLLQGLHAQTERIAPPLLEGFAPETPYWLEQYAFSQRFRRSPLKRAKRQGMLRNVCVALGNWADPVTVTPLQLALADDEPLVRGHAAWALGRVRACHGDERAASILQNALIEEREAWVAEEIRLAL